MENTAEELLEENAIEVEKRKRPKPAKIALIVVGILVALVIAVIIAFNIYMRVTYSTFFDQAQKEFPIPGTNQGFVVQDLDNLEPSDTWLFSGYESAGGPSPIYRRSGAGEVDRIYAAYPDGSPYEGHGSGITSTEEYVYLTCEEGYLVFPLAAIESAESDSSVQALGMVELDFSPAFLNVEGDTLYTGNFHYPGNYETPEEQHIPTVDGQENPAVLYAYPASWQEYGFAELAEYVFSIPSKVQGMCLTASGKLVLSTSWGFSTSSLLVYDLSAIQEDGSFIADGRDVPLYILDSRSLVEDFALPPMSEGIEFYNGRIYITDEAASAKYLFGRLFGFDDVYSLEL